MLNPRVDRELDELIRDYQLDCDYVCWFSRAIAFALLIAIVAVFIVGCGGGVYPECDGLPPGALAGTEGTTVGPQPPRDDCACYAPAPAGTVDHPHKPTPVNPCDPRGR